MPDKLGEKLKVGDRGFMMPFPASRGLVIEFTVVALNVPFKEPGEYTHGTKLVSVADNHEDMISDTRYGGVFHKHRKTAEQDASYVRANYNGKCMNCGESPTVTGTGMCGPCTFGEADTYGGNW